MLFTNDRNMINTALANQLAAKSSATFPSNEPAVGQLYLSVIGKKPMLRAAAGGGGGGGNVAGTPSSNSDGGGGGGGAAGAGGGMFTGWD